MLQKFMFLTAVVLGFSSSAVAQSSFSCTGPGLSALLDTDIGSLERKKLEANFAKAMGGADAYSYSEDGEVKIITTVFESDAGKAEMNFFLQDAQSYLMEYHIVQNSNFFAERDSVVLTDERSFYHVCDGELLAPAFGGIINEEIYDNLKLVLELIMTEEAIK